MAGTLPLLRPLPWVCAALLGGLTGACADRPVTPDYGEYIEDSCVSSCTAPFDCGLEVVYADPDECIDECIHADRWSELNQCTSAELKFKHCYGTMSCAEIEVFNAWNLGDDSSTDFPCFELLVESYNCDPNEPIDPL